MKDRITKLIKSNKLTRARELITDYETKAGKDSGIYAMKSVITIKEGRLNEAKRFIQQGLNFKINKKGEVDLDLLYNLGYIYEEEEEYLKAIETYERIVFNMEPSTERKEVIQKINSIEANYKSEIETQLENRPQDLDLISNPEYKYVHLMYDNFYCNKFMHFVNENFEEDEHLFLYLVPEDHKFKHIEFDKAENTDVIDFNDHNLQRLREYLSQTNKIFIHYLFNHICKLVCKWNIKKELYWVLFGGDLYNYLTDFEMFAPKTKELLNELGTSVDNMVDEDSIKYLCRKSTIRKINYILTHNKMEYKKVKESFLIKAEKLDYLFPHPIDLNLLQEQEDEKVNLNDNFNLKKDYNNIILVGNSANPSNNHIDILYELATRNLNNCCVIMPLSYSGHEKYVKKLIKRGNEILGDKFIPLTNYLDQKSYIKLLQQVDVGIFNHKRQQGVGNILTLLYLGKKVYLRKEVSTYSWLTENSIKLFQISELYNKELKDIIKLDDSIKKENKNHIVNTFNMKNYLNPMKKIFNQ